MKFRFDDEIELKIDESIHLAEFYICPGTLQILTENVFKHNLHSKEQPIIISIINKDNEIQVINNLQPLTSLRYESFGIGLESVKTRMEILATEGVTHDMTNTEYIVRIPKIINP